MSSPDSIRVTVDIPVFLSRLLYDLARTLAAANVYIANAVIATYGEQVVDAFYVKDMFGLKYYSASKQRTLDKKLREAIAEGAKRADI